MKTHCKNGHELISENVRVGKGTGRVCKACQKMRCRKWTKENGVARRAATLRAKEETREKKAQLVEYKGGQCLDCSGVFPTCCYHFDHRDPLQKSAGIAQMMHRPIEEIKQEADKCDLVCANCHAIRTYGNELVGRKISASKLGKWKD